MKMRWNLKELTRSRQWFGKFGQGAGSRKLNKRTDKAVLEKRLKEMQGSLKSSGALKTLMEERRKG